MDSKGILSFNSFLSYSGLNSNLPDKPDQVVYSGLAGRIVEAINPHTEADPIAILIQLLTIFGNIVGRNSFFRVEADEHYPNLFAVIVGDTSKGRKGTSWGHCKRISQEASLDWAEKCLKSGLSSGEGLINTIQIGGNEKRLLVMESEFAATLKVAERDQNILSPVLREAWDCGDLHVLTRNSPLHATGAHISIIGHITKEELRRSLTSTDIANGYANRFLWVCSKRSKLLPEGGDLSWNVLKDSISTFKEAVSFGSQRRELKRNGEARDLWYDIYERLSTPCGGIVGAITSRAEAQTMRLALLYALLDQSTEIKRPRLEAALKLWEYSAASVAQIFGDSLGDPAADLILRSLRNTPNGLTRTAISTNLFKGNKDRQQIGRALSVLLGENLIRFEHISTNGRSEERWYAATKETKDTKKAEPCFEEPTTEAPIGDGRPQPIC